MVRHLSTGDGIGKGQMKDKAGHLIWATLPTLRGVGHQCWATFPRCRAGLGTIVGHLPTLNEVTGMSINSWVGHQCWATFHLPRIAPRCSMTGRAPLKGHISPALIKVQWGWGVGHLEGPHCPCCSRSQIVGGCRAPGKGHIAPADVEFKLWRG